MLNKLLPFLAFSFIITSAGISTPVFADTLGGWPAECGAQPAGGAVAHGPLTANPVGNSVTLNTVTTAVFPNPAVIFVLDPGIGSSTQNAGFINQVTPVAVQFNGLSPGPHTAVVCYVTVVNTGHSDIVNFVISDSPVAGEIIPIDATSLILAGVQSFSWMIPVMLSVLGIGLFVVSRKS